MKHSISSLILGSMAAVLLCTAGCNNTPFAPIAVPKATSMRPEFTVKKQDHTAELKRLQHVSAPAYRIMPEDIFSFIVPEREDLSRPNVKIMSDGAISIAPIGYVKLSGLTIPEASQILSQKFQKYIKDCEIVLEPVSIKPATITIVGAVSTYTQ